MSNLFDSLLRVLKVKQLIGTHPTLLSASSSHPHLCAGFSPLRTLQTMLSYYNQVLACQNFSLKK